MQISEETKVIKVYESFRLGYCRCGCKKEINIRNQLGFLSEYKPGHWLRANKPVWYKNGIRYTNNYRYIYIPDYFSADSNGYVAEHIYVYQEFHKCCVIGEVHHIDPVREGYCNNMWWNLLGVTKAQHRTLDRTKNSDNWRCSECDSGTRIKPNSRPMWYYNKDDNLLCDKCYKKSRYVKKVRKPKNWEGTTCIICGSDKTTKNRHGNPRWNKYKNGYSCMKCYKKLRYYKIKNK